jgi:ribosomal protein S18 acetylase RimI-like enzyme
MRFEHVYLTDSFDREEYMCDIINAFENKVGFCKYYKNNLYDNIVYIEYICINDDEQRKGYATELVKELSKRYQLGWDHRFTEKGRMWYNGLIKKSIINPII